MHFKADGTSAQCYDGDTPGVVMTVYGSEGAMPPDEDDRSTMMVNRKNSGPTISNNVTITPTGCDGIQCLQFGGKKENWCFITPPSAPGKLEVSFDPSSAYNNWKLELEVTTDYVPPPPWDVIVCRNPQYDPFDDPTEVAPASIKFGKNWPFYFQDTNGNFNSTDSRVKVTAVSLKDAAGADASLTEDVELTGGYGFGDEWELNETQVRGIRWRPTAAGPRIMTMTFDITFTPGAQTQLKPAQSW